MTRNWRSFYDTEEARALERQGIRNAEAAIAAGEDASPFSRTQRRALKRQLAKAERGVAKAQARVKARQEGKARRAGLR